MRDDPSHRSRSVLLTRWRAAPAEVRESITAVVSVVDASSVAVPLNSAEEIALFCQFEAEVRNAVAQPMADALMRMLAGSRTAVLADRNPATLAASLLQLDLLEDVLDALLLSDADSRAASAAGPQPR